MTWEQGEALASFEALRSGQAISKPGFDRQVTTYNPQQRFGDEAAQEAFTLLIFHSIDSNNIYIYIYISMKHRTN